MSKEKEDARPIYLKTESSERNFIRKIKKITNHEYDNLVDLVDPHCLAGALDSYGYEMIDVEMHNIPKDKILKALDSCGALKLASRKLEIKKLREERLKEFGII